MTVAQLIERLQRIPPETVVVKFHQGPEGYDDVYFLFGTHEGHADHPREENFLRVNRAKFVKGESRPDYLCRDDRRPSRAARIPFVVIS